MFRPLRVLRVVVPAGFLAGIAAFTSADEADAFFDDAYVHEIRLVFADENWFTTLYNSHADDAEDPYFPASFSCDGVTIEQVGVRMKGNSSFRGSSRKKSFKIDIDEYDEENDELRFMGLKKLNLNNCTKDPSLLREKLFLDFAGQFIPTIRCVHSRLYINDEYIGLYSVVEQVDKTFIEDRFGKSEDGNLFKGAASDDLGDAPQADFGSTLEWEGSDAASYKDHYQLKTNEADDDYSGLIEMIRLLNNTDPEAFPQTLESCMDVYNVLVGLALNSLFSNHDAYNGSAHNYYLYESDTTGQFSHILWDTNETFGTFSGYADGGDMRYLHPFWLTTRGERPLMEKLWENETYARVYLQIHDKMLNEGFDAETMGRRIDELADLIREDVYADTNKQTTNGAFERSLYYSDNRTYGLLDFVQERATYLAGVLETYELELPVTPKIYINELMADNDTILQDPDGTGYPDWFELYNPNAYSVDLSGMFLSDSEDTPRLWEIPEGVTIDPYGYLVFYADNDMEQGSTHTNFKLSASGEVLTLHDKDENGNTLIDLVEFGEQTPDISFGRLPDGSSILGQLDTATPGSSNGPRSFLGCPVHSTAEGAWVDAGDWLGWLEVSDAPWLWSLDWENWIYLDESMADANGVWVCILNGDSQDQQLTDLSTYLGFSIQELSGKRWINTGDWLGWLEVSSAPWSWSTQTNKWIFVNESSSSNERIWIYMTR